MDQSFDVGSVVAGRPSHGTLLRRGLAKRCPRCGGRGIYHNYFRMKDRCPTCGYLFEREPGFFTGAYLINLAITEGLLFVLLMGFLAWKVNNPEAGVAVALAVGLFLAIAAPIAFYPFARTIWSAIDLAMTPLELGEIVAAADAVEEPTDAGEGPEPRQPPPPPPGQPRPDLN
jgi:uncharacterized protein (DUF983 family)